ncbi:MAG TPA: bacteriohopanetetrol glucosamine biosynthesis glycosyltransferase HpnI [Tepidisphaeraceae bacterium]|nr:bacteriohopanetetrol glucosamine biosynthesis glycosyltransferase HpnI [Tepidisphaeraceae bacterium]
MIWHVLLIVLLSLCVVSCAFWLVALGCLRDVLRRPTVARNAGLRPMVSILKPIKGVDEGAMENFVSFCQQDYPSFEVLFGVANARDPAVQLVRQLQAKFPKLTIKLLVAEPLGTNPKSATLHRLAAEARGDVLAIADADIRVTPEFLARVVPPLEDPAVGLVTCLYRGESPSNVPARLESLHMDAAFAPSVALAWKLGNCVGLGATVVMRREDLVRAGGYAGIADHLLDDYEIAARIVRLGLKIHLSDYPVASVLGSMQFRQQWAREVRWSRGIRVANPLRYPGMIITFTLPLAIAAGSLSFVRHWAWTAVVLALVVRFYVGWRAAVSLGQRERGYLLLLPARDLLSAAVWAFALFGRRVIWRGQEFALRKDGRLECLPEPGLPDGLLARSIRRLDAYLRRKEGIFEFCDDPRCVLRVNVGPASSDLAFSDGTILRAGEPVAYLHLWNEHIGTIPKEGPDLQWAIALRQAAHFSFRQLAVAAANDPRLAHARAFGGNAVLVSRNGSPQIARLASRYGFEWVADERKRTFGRRVHELGENFLILGLQWAFNPHGIKGKGFNREREPLWMTREALLEKYHAVPVPHPAEAADPVAIEK